MPKSYIGNTLVTASYIGSTPVTLVTSNVTLTISEQQLPVYDTDFFDSGNATIAISGTHDALDTELPTLEYRLLNADNSTEIQGWTSFAASAGGVWSVNASRAPSNTPMRAQVRLQSAPGVFVTQVGEWFAGYIVAWFGQSLAARPLTSTSPAPTFTPPAKTMWFLVNDVNGTLSTGPEEITASSTLGLRRMAAVVGEEFDGPLLIVDMTHSGTARSALAEDANTSRNWNDSAANPVNYIRTRGSDICAVFDHWFTSDAATYLEFERMWAPFYIRKTVGGIGDNDDLSGIGDYTTGLVEVVNTRDYTPDHFMWDLSAAGDQGLFDATRTKWIVSWGASHWNVTTHTDGEVLTNDVQKGVLREAIRAIAESSTAFEAITPSSVAGWTGQEAFGGHLAQPAETHVASNDVDGESMAGVSQMENVARALGFLSRNEPRIQSAAWESTGAYVDITFTLPHGGTLSTPFIEHAAGNYDGSFEGDNWVTAALTPATLAELHHVQGFMVTQGGTPSFSGFTALIQDAANGIVRITPDTAFVDGDSLSFGYGDGVHLLTAAHLADSRVMQRWPIETRTHVSGTGYGYPIVRESGIATLYTASGISVGGGGGGATTFNTQAANVQADPTHFVDPANVPANTTKIEWRARMSYGTTLPSNTYIFAQESGGCDLRILANGKLRAVAEDSSGAAVLNPTNDFGAQPNAGAFNDFILVVDMVAQEVVLTVNGASQTQAFQSAGTGTFQSNRELSFLASSQGGNSMPADTTVEYLEVYLNDVLHKRIAGDAATVNADAWHRGEDAIDTP